MQIFKRHRDVWAAEGGKERIDLKPISAIITTLAGQAYSKICDEGRSYSTDFDVLLDVLELMPDYIRYSYGLYFVPNPSMPEENFAEKWNVEESRKGEKLRKILSYGIKRSLITLQKLHHLLEKINFLIILVNTSEKDLSKQFVRLWL